MEPIPSDGGSMQKRDYFAQRLLDKLPTVDPIFAAYEAQDVSREVGFDFTEIEDVLERALDEVRETREAHEEGPEGIDHFADEIADLAFSLTNLIRHKGLGSSELLSATALTAGGSENVDIYEATEDIAGDMKAIANVATDRETALAIYEVAMQKCAALAAAFGFEVGELLRANVKKYLDRCVAIETLADEDNKSWADLHANNEIVAYWKKAKSIL